MIEFVEPFRKTIYWSFISSNIIKCKVYKPFSNCIGFFSSPIDRSAPRLGESALGAGTGPGARGTSLRHVLSDLFQDSLQLWVQ